MEEKTQALLPDVLVEPRALSLPSPVLPIAAFILCSTHYPGSFCHWLAINRQGICGEYPCVVVQRLYGLFFSGRKWYLVISLTTVLTGKNLNVCECVTFKEEFRVSCRCCPTHSGVCPTSVGVLDSLLWSRSTGVLHPHAVSDICNNSGGGVNTFRMTLSSSGKEGERQILQWYSALLWVRCSYAEFTT